MAQKENQSKSEQPVLSRRAVLTLLGTGGAAIALNACLGQPSSSEAQTQQALLDAALKKAQAAETLVATQDKLINTQATAIANLTNSQGATQAFTGAEQGVPVSPTESVIISRSGREWPVTSTEYGIVPNWPQTADQEVITDFIMDIYVAEPIQPGDFTLEEVRSRIGGFQRNKDTGNIYAVELPPLRDNAEKITRAYNLRNPGPVAQPAQLANASLREACGLKLEEIEIINASGRGNLSPKDVGAGLPVIPGGGSARVWGATISVDSYYMALGIGHQTMAERCQ